AMICILTGNQGKFGTGTHNWSGNYKTGVCHGTPWSGAGIGAWGAEDAFNLNLDPKAHGKEIVTKYYAYGEEPAYWNHGDRGLIVNTPKYGRTVFTGKTHMPAPTKGEWAVNVNPLNNAKYHYGVLEYSLQRCRERIGHAASTTGGSSAKPLRQSGKGWSVMTRPDPPQPLWAHVHDPGPMCTPHGRFESSRIEPECLESGQNFVVG